MILFILFIVLLQKPIEGPKAQVPMQCIEIMRLATYLTGPAAR